MGIAENKTSIYSEVKLLTPVASSFNNPVAIRVDTGAIAL